MQNNDPDVSKIPSLIDSGHNTEARTIIRQAAAIVGRNNPTLNLLLAKTHKAENRHKYVLRYSTKALDEDPTNISAAIYAIEALIELQRPDEAETLARSASRFKDSGSQARPYIATALLAQNKLRQSLLIARRILQKTPKDKRALMAAAIVSHRLRYKQEALLYLETLIRLSRNKNHRNDKLLLFQLAADNAFLLDPENPTTRAKKYYKAALKLDPLDKQSLWGLSVCYLLEKQLASAKTLRDRMAKGKLSHEARLALADLDELLNEAMLEQTETKKTLARLAALNKFLRAAVQQGAETESLQKEYGNLLRDILIAAKEGKLPPLPERPNKEDRIVPDTFYEECEELNKAWQNQNVPLSQLRHRARKTLKRGSEIIESLTKDLAFAKTHYRPIERARGH